MTEKIQIGVISLGGSEIVDSLPDEISLHDDYLEYKWRAKVKSDGEELSFKGQSNLLKGGIISVSAHYDHSIEAYVCAVYTQNRDTDVFLHFATYEGSISVKNKIWKWLTK